MSSFTNRNAVLHADRRRNARFTLDVPVVLRTVACTRECRIVNISDLGARLDTASPPCEGASAWLVIGEDEFYCTIAWSEGSACGVKFERGLGEEKLIAITGTQLKDEGPVAQVGNIKAGRKRGALVSGG
ncbi:MAG: PilZ domain-containing protein [Erythrobacter sp.]|jgi:hypothetical protein|nr:PilZ domain-containing protein [Erythrobacter sp.]